jgi:hypothetical protein
MWQQFLQHCNYHLWVILPESFRQPYIQRWLETILESCLKLSPSTYSSASRLIHICISRHSTFIKLGMHVLEHVFLTGETRWEREHTGANGLTSHPPSPCALKMKVWLFFKNIIFILFFLKMKVSHLTSYFDEDFFGFIFWWRLHTLTSYFDEDFIFSLKNKGFTTNFIFWQNLHTLTSYYDKDFIFSLKNHISTKVSFFSLKKEGFTTSSVFWWRFLWLCISTKATHFDFVFRWKFFFLWKTKVSQLTSSFYEGFFGLVF